MSLNAVQLFLQGQIDGLTSPGVPPVEAWVLPPPVTTPAENPQVYIWGGSLHEHRATLARTQAQKSIAYKLQLYVQWMSENDPATVQNFPMLLDALRAKIRSINLLQPIIDPTTGEQSQTTDLGETIEISYSRPVASADQRYLINTATVNLPFHEWINPA